MTTPSRRRALAASLEQQLVEFRSRGDPLPELAHLLTEYVDRAMGFSQLDGSDEAELAAGDHVTLIALASRSLLDEISRTVYRDSTSLRSFQSALLVALLAPSPSTLDALHAFTETLTAELVDGRRG